MSDYNTSMATTTNNSGPPRAMGLLEHWYAVQPRQRLVATSVRVAVPRTIAIDAAIDTLIVRALPIMLARHSLLRMNVNVDSSSSTTTTSAAHPPPHPSWLPLAADTIVQRANSERGDSNHVTRGNWRPLVTVASVDALDAERLACMEQQVNTEFALSTDRLPLWRLVVLTQKDARGGESGDNDDESASRHARDIVLVAGLQHVIADGLSSMVFLQELLRAWRDQLQPRALAATAAADASSVGATVAPTIYKETQLPPPADAVIDLRPSWRSLFGTVFGLLRDALVPSIKRSAYDRVYVGAPAGWRSASSPASASSLRTRLARARISADLMQALRNACRANDVTVHNVLVAIGFFAATKAMWMPSSAEGGAAAAVGVAGAATADVSTYGTVSCITQLPVCMTTLTPVALRPKGLNPATMGNFVGPFTGEQSLNLETDLLDVARSYQRELRDDVDGARHRVGLLAYLPDIAAFARDAAKDTFYARSATLELSNLGVVPRVSGVNASESAGESAGEPLLDPLDWLFAQGVHYPNALFAVNVVTAHTGACAATVSYPAPLVADAAAQRFCQNWEALVREFVKHEQSGAPRPSLKLGQFLQA